MCGDPLAPPSLSPGAAASLANPLSTRLRSPIMYRLLITRNELLASIFPPGMLDPAPQMCVCVCYTSIRRANIRTLNGAAAFPRDLCGNVVVGWQGVIAELSLYRNFGENRVEPGATRVRVIVVNGRSMEIGKCQKMCGDNAIIYTNYPLIILAYFYNKYNSSFVSQV